MPSRRHRRPLASPLIAAFAALFLLLGASGPAAAAHKKHFRIAWTIYVGWMPWEYAQESGIIKKWGKKYGIDIDVVQVNDYIQSINQYTAGSFDGCAMTNMDALTIPAAGGVDSTALIVGDFSNGNDGIVLKGKDKLSDIKGQRVNLVQFSVSHYLLARALQSIGLTERDVTTVNTSDSDIVAAFTTPQVTSVVTWNPLLMAVKKMPGAHEVFNSSQIPGEIMDLMVVKTQTLKDNPALGKALTGAWYEIMALMSKHDAAAKAARTQMAKASGTDLAGFDAQLKTTRMFYKPAAAVAFMDSPKIVETMKHVAKFSFDHGLLGQGATSPDFVGMAFPGGVTLGAKNNIKFRFDPEYMKLAAEGKL